MQTVRRSAEVQTVAISVEMSMVRRIADIFVCVVDVMIHSRQYVVPFFFYRSEICSIRGVSSVEHPHQLRP